MKTYPKNHIHEGLKPLSEEGRDNWDRIFGADRKLDGGPSPSVSESSEEDAGVVRSEGETSPTSD